MNPRLQEICREAIAWRQDIHRHPELGFDVERTSGFVAKQLRSFGFDEVATGIGRTGVVGRLKGRNGSCTNAGNVAFRADMDALPIHEQTDVAHRSAHVGKMHACGHDGHTAMLLAAAKYLAETRDFPNEIAFVFQPAEEVSGGAAEMLADGLIENFGIGRAFALHNLPGLAVGAFAVRVGPIMAASDVVTIEITGTGGHAAFPHTCVDPVIVGASILLNMQTIVSRGVSPLESAVVTFPIFEAGTAVNVIPAKVVLRGAIRTLNPQVRQNVLARITEISRAAGIAFGIDVRTTFENGYPATVNDADSVTMLREATERIPTVALTENCDPLLATEDFSYILSRVPGALAFIGNGDTARLHQPLYDFNDEALVYGASFWVSMAQGKRLSLVTRHNPTLGTLIERSS